MINSHMYKNIYIHKYIVVFFKYLFHTAWVAVCPTLPVEELSDSPGSILYIPRVTILVSG